METQYYSRRSQELQTLRASVIIPLAQGAINAILWGACLLSLLSFLKRPDEFRLVASVCVCTFTASWFAGVRWWRSQVEPLSYPGPERGYPGPEPAQIIEAEPASVRMELISDGGHSGEFIDLPASPSKLVALARGLVDGSRSLTEASLCGGHNALFTRSEFVKLRDELVKRKLLDQVSPSTPARGYRLSRGGHAAVKYLASLTL